MIGLAFRGLMYAGTLFGAKEAADYGSEHFTGKDLNGHWQGSTAQETAEIIGDKILEGLTNTFGLSEQEVAQIESLVGRPESEIDGARDEDAPGIMESQIEAFTAAQAYKLVEGMGVDEETFYTAWDRLNITDFAATFAKIKAADFALDKALGVDLIDTKTTAMLAAILTVLDKTGLLDKAVDYAKENNLLSGAQDFAAAAADTVGLTGPAPTEEPVGPT